MLPSVISIQVETTLKSFLLNLFDMSSLSFHRDFGITVMDGFSTEKGHLSKSPSEHGSVITLVLRGYNLYCGDMNLIE